MKTFLAFCAVLAMGAVGGAYFALHGLWQAPSLPAAAKVVLPPAAQAVAKPAPSTRAPSDALPSAITAMGIVKPEELVEVGAQVNGMIESFGTDPADPGQPIDHGSTVHKGDVLAKIDPAVYQAQVDYAKASLSRAEADLLQLKAKRDQAKNEWLRAQSLLPEKAIADSDYDAIASNYHVAMANVSVGEAAVQQTEAQLRIAKTYLSYTIIKSPIDGVIIDRRVSVGQTVMAALNAPAMFVIAKDLRRVQVWASVKETDIGRIQPGLRVRFTVDAYPGEVFEGKVTEILLNPTKSQNCTTYTVVVSTNNSHGMLPYLTAKLRFELGHRKAEPTADVAGGRRPRALPAAPAVYATAPGGLAGQPADKKTSPGHVPSALPKPPNPGKKLPAKAAGQA
jgi:HlyD family secretion protein